MEHLVLLKFKDSLDKKDEEEFVKQTFTLLTQIPGKICLINFREYLRGTTHHQQRFYGFVTK